MTSGIYNKSKIIRITEKIFNFYIWKLKKKNNPKNKITKTKVSVVVVLISKQLSRFSMTCAN